LAGLFGLHIKAMPRPKAKLSRDPQRTRARILEAAYAEFSSKGFAGARVDTIARRAGNNKRMLYHYFTDKKGLFSAVVREKLAQRHARVFGSPEEFIASLPGWFGKHCATAPCRAQCSPSCPAAWLSENSRNKDWVRLLAWEALQSANGKVVEEPHRRRVYRRTLTHVRKEKKFAPEFAPEHLQLAMVSLSMFPLAMPQITRMIVGQPPDAPGFLHRYTDFLKRFAVAMRPSLQG
jgi:TetR/AcrR family transcriptional regulator